MDLACGTKAALALHAVTMTNGLHAGRTFYCTQRLIMNRLM